MGDAIKGTSAACRNAHKEMVCGEGTENYPWGGEKISFW